MYNIQCLLMSKQMANKITTEFFVVNTDIYIYIYIYIYYWNSSVTINTAFKIFLKNYSSVLR